jgi:hypothetical protein
MRIDQNKLVLGLLVLWTGCLRDGCDGPSWDAGCKPGDLGQKGNYRFVGLGTIDDPEGFSLHPTSVGGTQPIQFFKEDEDAASYSTYRTAHPSFLTVASSPKGPTIFAHMAGGTDLELVTKGGSVVDAIAIRAVVVTPKLVYDHVSKLPLAALRKQTIEMRLSLETSTGQDAVDDSAEIGATGGAVHGQGKWYDWQVTPAASASTLVLAAKSGTRTSEVLSLPIVEAIGELRLTNEDKLLAGPLSPNTAYEACPYAETNAQELIGIEPTITTKGSIFATSSLYGDERCVTFTTASLGTATITLAVGTKKRIFDLIVGGSDLGVGDLGPDDLGVIDGGNDL